MPEPGRPVLYRTVETYLFDTCVMRCGYCWLAESGRVLDNAQLAPYRDPAYIDRITDFFNARTDERNRWTLQLTGGEPLIMPNFDRFCGRLFSRGNRVSVYTSLGVGTDSPNFRFLLGHPAPDVDYIIASFHPESEQREEEYFDKVRSLKKAGHRIIVRLVGHPARLESLERLDAVCRGLDVCFFPATLFSDRYPGAYTEEERGRLSRYFTSLSQVIQLAGGVDTSQSLCFGGSRLLALNVASGDFTPCITVHEPVLGNLHKGTLALEAGPIRCPKAGITCNCDIHYQQNIVVGAEDSEAFARQKNGYVDPWPAGEQKALLESRNIRLSNTADMGIGSVRNDQTLFYDRQVVREAYERYLQEHR